MSLKLPESRGTGPKKTQASGEPREAIARGARRTWRGAALLGVWMLAHSALAAENSQLAAALNRVLGGPQLRGSRVGVLVVDLPSGKRLFESRSQQGYTPASNQKLFVAHAALANLGPDHRFTTRLYTRGPIHDGLLEGDLYLVGGGDPGLTTGGLYEMASALREAGVRRITGDLVLDETHFSLPGNQYVGGATAKTYFAPKSALTLNYNTVAFGLEGKQPGQPAVVWSETPGAFVRFSSRVVTGDSTDLAISRSQSRGENRFSLAGSVAAGETVRVARAITEPTAYCRDAFTAILGELGIELAGTTRREPVPADAVLLREQTSAPVSELVYDMNKASNNFVADMLALEMGAIQEGGPATWGKAASTLTAHLAGLGLHDTLVADGSGLSPQNRTTPSDLVAVLQSAYGSPFWPEYVASLPIGGRDGTLHQRLADPGVYGRVRGKTGTISGASTLSGYVFRADGRVLAYSLLINHRGLGLGVTHTLLDQMVRAIVTAPLDPLPPEPTAAPLAALPAPASAKPEPPLTGSPLATPGNVPTPPVR